MKTGKKPKSNEIISMNLNFHLLYSNQC